MSDPTLTADRRNGIPVPPERQTTKPAQEAQERRRRAAALLQSMKASQRSLDFNSGSPREQEIAERVARRARQEVY